MRDVIYWLDLLTCGPSWFDWLSACHPSRQLSSSLQSGGAHIKRVGCVAAQVLRHHYNVAQIMELNPASFSSIHPFRGLANGLVHLSPLHEAPRLEMKGDADMLARSVSF